MSEEAIPGTSPLKRGSPFTCADYKSWPEGVSWELISGEAYAMSPAPKRVHQGLAI